MCSRYELNANPRQLARQFGLSADPALPNQAEIRPTDQGLIITPQREGELRSWGIPAPWSGMGDGKPIFNARAETLSRKATFRPFLDNRCVVPATTFPEWRKDGKQRFKYRISISGDTVAEPEIMAFAALFDASYYTVITCAAAPRMAPVHSRMPVILSPAAVAKWLDPDCEFQEAASVMVPYLGDDLRVEEDIALGIVAQSSQADLFN